jgi:hypothetical protein
MGGLIPNNAYLDDGDAKIARNFPRKHGKKSLITVYRAGIHARGVLDQQPHPGVTAAHRQVGWVRSSKGEKRRRCIIREYMPDLPGNVYSMGGLRASSLRR